MYISHFTTIPWSALAYALASLYYCTVHRHCQAFRGAQLMYVNTPGTEQLARPLSESVPHGLFSSEYGKLQHGGADSAIRCCSYVLLSKSCRGLKTTDLFPPLSQDAPLIFTSAAVRLFELYGHSTSCILPSSAYMKWSRRHCCQRTQRLLSGKGSLL